MCFVFFKQKTAYEMRISDWSSDVCSSDLNGSVTDMLHLRPNQALHWYAMRYWKARGVHLHDWGGTGDYKKNYGPDEYRYIRPYRSALPWLDQVRDRKSTRLNSSP